MENERFDRSLPTKSHTPWLPCLSLMSKTPRSEHGPRTSDHLPRFMLCDKGCKKETLTSQFTDFCRGVGAQKADFSMFRIVISLAAFSHKIVMVFFSLVFHQISSSAARCGLHVWYDVAKVRKVDQECREICQRQRRSSRTRADPKLGGASRLSRATRAIQRLVAHDG